MDQNSFNQELTNIELKGYKLDSQYSANYMYTKLVESQIPLSIVASWFNERRTSIFPVTKQYIIERFEHYGKDVTSLNIT